MDSNTQILMAERENALKIAAIEEKLKEYEKQHGDYEKRLLAIERSSEKTEFQYQEIMKALNKLNDKTIPDLIKDINGNLNGDENATRADLMYSIIKLMEVKFNYRMVATLCKIHICLQSITFSYALQLSLKISIKSFNSLNLLLIL